MSKSKFRSFLEFIGLGEIHFDDDKASVTVDQAAEASVRLDAIQKENATLKATNEQLTADHDVYTSRLATLELENEALKQENETLKKGPGAQSTKAITNKDAGNNADNPCVTSPKNDFMDNMRNFETEYSFLKR